MITKLPSFATSNKISSSMMICHDSVIGNVHEEIVVSQRDNFSRIVLNNLHYPQFDGMNDLFEIGIVKDNEDCKVIEACFLSMNITEDEVAYNCYFRGYGCNSKAVADIGYEVNDININFEFNFPKDNSDGFNILDFDWIRSVALNELEIDNIPLRELCKIIFEFFEPIRDGRLNWK